MIFKVLPRFETTVATILRAFVWLIVTLMDIHVGQTFFLRIELIEAISTLCVIADI